MLEKLLPDPFLKNQNWAYFWINILKIYYVCFYCMPSWELLKLLNPRFQLLAFNLYKAFLKNKKEVWNVWRNTFFLLHSITRPHLTAWLHLVCAILSNTCIVIVCDVINFEIKFTFLIKPFFSTWPKSLNKKTKI